MSRITNQVVVGVSVGFILFLVVGTSAAQSEYEYNDTPSFYQPVNPWPVEMGFSQDHSSTAAEGYQRGRAAVIQALGNYEVNISQAEILREQNRALRRDNDLLQTKALHTQQKMWIDNRFETRKDRDERMAEGLEKLAARRAVIQTQAYQLSAFELDPITGEIHWLESLRGPEFRAERERIEELYRRHVGYETAPADMTREIARSVDQWSRELQNKITTMPREEYVASHKFLLGLKYSAGAMVQG